MISDILNLYMQKVPKEWFFFNPKIKSNHKYFYKISKQTGVIFYNNNIKNQNDFFLMIEPYTNWCHINRIKFVIPCSIYWANKYKAYGVFLDIKVKEINNLLNIKILRKKFFLVTKVHNFVESLSSAYFNFVFISSVFHTKSHPNRKPLKKGSFFSLCFLLRKKIVFALGGVTKSNYKQLRNRYLYGYGAISNFTQERNQ